MNPADDKVLLIRPEKRYLLSYLEGCKESFSSIHDRYIIHDPGRFEIWKDTIFIQYQKSEAGIDLPPGFVPSITFWLVNDNDFIGCVNLRLRLTPELTEYGGHLGCFIRAGMRHRGYGTLAFKLALKEARRHRISPVLLTCTGSNVASYRQLEKFPYQKMELDHAVVDGIDQPIRRFFFL